MPSASVFVIFLLVQLVIGQQKQEARQQTEINKLYESDLLLATNTWACRQNLTRFHMCRAVVRCPDNRTGRCMNKSSILAASSCPLDKFECLDERGRIECVSNNSSAVLTDCVNGVQFYGKCHHEYEFTCVKTKRCIPRRWVRDGSYDCGIDEKTNELDDSDERTPLTTCDVTIEFRCDDHMRRCIPRDQVMDGVGNCLGSGNSSVDEQQPLPTCYNNTEFRCHGSARCILRHQVNDGKRDCGDGSDENLRSFPCHPETERSCAGSGRCVPKWWLGSCNASDSSNVTVAKRDGDGVRCHDDSRSILPEQMCDGRRDCADCSDETAMCGGSPSMFKCESSSMCLPWSFVGDGSADCVDGSDERTPQYGFKCDNNTRVVSQFSIGLKRQVCRDRSDSSPSMCLDSSNKQVGVSQLCDGRSDCPDNSDECTCQYTPLCEECNWTGITTLSDTNCTDLPPRWFTCRNEEKNISVKQRFDGVEDCSDFSDECSTKPDQYKISFSSHTEMISALYMKLFFWVVSLVTIVGNLSVFYSTVVKLRTCRNRKSVFFYNRVLIGNLAISDALMGVCLLTIVIKSLQFSGKYCEYDMAWRTSITCNTIGVLSSISTQTSINLVVTMTFLRLRSTLQPFRPYVISRGFFFFLIAVCWLFSLASAIYPMLAFVEYIQIEPSPFFTHNLINHTTMDEYVEKTMFLMGNNNVSKTTPTPQRARWYELPPEIAARDPTRDIKIKRHFGYYNLNAVCFPDYFIPTVDQTSIRITVCIYNGLVLVFVAVSYFFIYRMSTHRKGSSKSHVQVVENEKMKMRMTLVIFIDVMMLIPIIILVMLNQTVPQIMDPSRCSVASIFFLPISSFINPLLYGRIHRSFQHNLSKRILRRRRASESAKSNGNVVDNKFDSHQPTVIEMQML